MSFSHKEREPGGRDAGTTPTGPPFRTDGRALGSPSSVPSDPVEPPSSGPPSSGSQHLPLRLGVVSWYIDGASRPAEGEQRPASKTRRVVERDLRLLLTPAHLAAAQYLFADLGDDDVSHIGGRGATGRGRGRARWSPAGAEWWAERSMHRMLAWGYDARGLRSGRRK